MNQSELTFMTKKDVDDRLGMLSFFQTNTDIHFEIKRLYYIYGAKQGTKRGMHAHKELEQITFCPYGIIRFVLDDGYDTEEVLLDQPNQGLVIGKGIWRDMYWEQDDSVLVVAASLYYDEKDYIRDYDEFLKMVREGYWKKDEKKGK